MVIVLKFTPKVKRVLISHIKLACMRFRWTKVVISLNQLTVELKMRYRKKDDVVYLFVRYEGALGKTKQLLVNEIKNAVEQENKKKSNLYKIPHLKILFRENAH